VSLSLNSPNTSAKERKMSPNPVTPLNSPLHIIDTTLRVKASVNLDREVQEELAKNDEVEKTVAELILINEHKSCHL
jgi:hypothetical protein